MHSSQVMPDHSQKITPLEIVDWGCTEYAEALSRQQHIVTDRIKGAVGDRLILTEHNAVYTLGRRKGARKHLLWDANTIKNAGIALHQSNRGGDITYHGPGQIVAYPILSLRPRKDLHAYLRDLEEVVIRTLKHYDIKATRRDGLTGVWVETRKICAFGVAVKSWVTYHGLALNIDPDLSHFSGILACGITDGTVTSMAAEMGSRIDGDLVKSRLAVEFQNVFRDILNANGYR